MVSAYIPDAGVQEHLKEQKDMPIWKLRWEKKKKKTSKNGKDFFTWWQLRICKGFENKFFRLIDLYHFCCRYTSNGSTLYSGCEDGVLRRYRRYPDHHHYLGSVFTHKGDIQDLDISPYDECILFKNIGLGFCAVFLSWIFLRDEIQFLSHIIPALLHLKICTDSIFYLIYLNHQNGKIHLAYSFFSFIKLTTSKALQDSIANDREFVYSM